MSFAFEIAASGSRRVRRLGVALHAVGWAGVVLTAVQGVFAGDPTVWIPALALALALASGIIAARAVRRSGRAATPGDGNGRDHDRSDIGGQAGGADALALHVNAGGQCALRRARSAPTRFDPTRWFAVAGVAWISGRADGRGVSLLIGADCASPHEWGRLLRWLRWLDRGGPGAD